MRAKTEIRIISQSDAGLRTCAAAGRISTQEGTALEIFDRSLGGERDLNLLKKVLGSGHKSVMEHHSFSIALQNVSVLVEQFLIEHRLASYIVKSRRYVNFERAGFHVPPALTGPLLDAYNEAMEARFRDYGALLALGVPKEDARFVLPYCFHSNLYMTLNARALVHLICEMRGGRGRECAEIRAIGAQLEAQFGAVYPGVIDAENANIARCAPEPVPAEFAPPHRVCPSVALLSAPMDAQALLGAALAFTGRFDGMPLTDAVRALTRDARPRELECLCYTYAVRDVSLASVTHYARHRIQSPLFRDVRRALAGGGYILPATVAAHADTRAIYDRAFAANHAALGRCMALGLAPEDSAYFALAGCTTDILITLNARELLHFLQLRTCTRAQWEIRELSLSLLDQLRQSAPEIFRWFGPSCAVRGACPEGRMSCGVPQRFDEGDGSP